MNTRGENAPYIEILPITRYARSPTLTELDWFFTVVAPLFPTEVFRKPLSPMGFFRIADFNPKLRADSPTAENIKTAISPLLRLLLVVNQKCLLLLFLSHHGPLLEKHKTCSLFLTLICDNIPAQSSVFQAIGKSLQWYILS